MSRIVIVGGGVAGLAAGIYARLKGNDVAVYEKHTVPGGNLTGWNRKGYHIDNCIHWLTGTNPSSNLHGMWKELGVLDGVGIYQGESLFAYDGDGERVMLTPSLEGLRQQMYRVSKNDKKEIDSLLSAIELLMATDNIAGKDCNEGVTVSRAMRGAIPLLKYYGMTTGELASRFNSHALQGFITGFWGEDFGALALIYVFATYCGRNGGLPEGGSLKAAERMAERLKSLGGHIWLGSEVTGVNIKGKKAVSITLADGNEVFGDYFILATDPRVSFDRLMGIPMPKKLQKLYDDKNMRRFSAYHTAFACDTDSLPFSGDVIFDLPDEKAELLHTKQLILREFSHEPSFAPEGKNILQTLTFCFEEDSQEFIRLRESDRAAYSEKKQMISTVIISAIEDKFPELQGKLSLIDLWTPASYKRFIGSDIGSFMSFAMPKKYLPIPMGGELKDIENLILATQWLQSPGGLPIAACSGKAAVDIIEKKCKG